jgi:hypothetical protein
MGREKGEIAIGINFCNEEMADTRGARRVIHNKKREEKKRKIPMIAYRLSYSR